jgi:hypothetical protein
VVLVPVERVVTRAPTTEDATDAAMQEDAGNMMEAIIYFPEAVKKICDGGEQRGGNQDNEFCKSSRNATHKEEEISDGKNTETSRERHTQREDADAPTHRLNG